MIGDKVGCDIHVCVETRNKDTGKWEGLFLYKKQNDKVEKIPVYDGRDYGLFGMLAGVRSASGSLVPLRGLPDDTSDYVDDEYGDGEYFHSATWYDFCELAAYDYAFYESSKVIKELLKHGVNCDYETERDYINICGCDDFIGIGYNLNQIESLHGFVDNIRQVLNAYDIYEPMPGDVRVIMWFD